MPYFITDPENDTDDNALIYTGLVVLGMLILVLTIDYLAYYLLSK